MPTSQLPPTFRREMRGRQWSTVDMDCARYSIAGRAFAPAGLAPRRQPNSGGPGHFYQERASRKLGRAASPVPDSELIALCLSGQQFAWDALIERYQALIYTCARRCGLSESESSDVLQQVCVTLYRELGSVRDHSKLASWLAMTAKRESWRAVRRNSSAPPPGDPLIAAQTLVDERPEADPVMSLVEREDMDLVRVGLDQLGDRCRALLSRLYASDEPQYVDIAAEFDMPIGSIGPTRARCLAKLKTILVEMGF